FGADLARHARHFARECVELVHDRVDGFLQLQDFAGDVHCDLLRQVAAGDGRCDVRDVAHLGGQVAAHEVHAVGEVLPRPGTPRPCAGPLTLPSVPTSRATRVTSEAKPFNWSTIVLMVSFSSRISPRTSTVILRDRSPRATAVVTCAMLRT